MPALATTQEWTAEKLLRLAPSVQFQDLLGAIGVGDKYVPHRKPILPEMLKGKSGCSGCIACVKSPKRKDKRYRSPKLKEGKKAKKEANKPKSEEFISELLSSTDSDSN